MRSFSAFYRRVNNNNFIVLKFGIKKNSMVLTTKGIVTKIVDVKKENNIKFYIDSSGNKFTISQIWNIIANDSMFSDSHLKAIEQNKLLNNCKVSIDVEVDFQDKKISPVLKNGFIIIRKVKQNKSKNLFDALSNNRSFNKIKELKNVKEYKHFLKDLNDSLQCNNNS